MPDRILIVTTLDLMAWVLLRPWLAALLGAGYEVHLACSRGPYWERLAGVGLRLHDVGLRRSFNPFAHLAPLLALYRLIRAHRFGLVNTHSPVAAAVGRLAAWLAGCPRIVYTVHGFYFHENMPLLPRLAFTVIERLLGRLTNHFMFVSEEDRQTALRARIARHPAQTDTIYNGVDLGRFTPLAPASGEALDLRRGLGLPGAACVVGIVGRIVREKGYREFLEMARQVAARRPDAVFLVVGDDLASDRDHFGGVLRRRVRAANLAWHFVFTGFTEQVAGYLRAMDVFVLPSYREGLPRSVLEAMGCGIPVVATAIRGCREAVVRGKTGLLVAPRDAGELTRAVMYLLDHPEMAARMGRAGRRRAEEVYDQRLVQERFVGVLSRVLDSAAPSTSARQEQAAWQDR